MTGKNLRNGILKWGNLIVNHPFQAMYDILSPELPEIMLSKLTLTLVGNMSIWEKILT
jgi:hypothetical protein